MPIELYVFFLFWITFIGMTVGSFLNVVVYRLPRGMSLSFPGSHCPKCGHKIRPRHNIPVFGWLMLRGRCFDCHEPISVRYPIVEAITGILWLITSVILDREYIEPHGGGNFQLWFVLSMAAGIAVSAVWAFILIRWDRFRSKK